MKDNVVLAAIILGTAIIVAAILICSHSTTSSAAACCSQRFQISVGANHAFIIDTSTGQTWETYRPSNTGSPDEDFSKPKTLR